MGLERSFLFLGSKCSKYNRVFFNASLYTIYSLNTFVVFFGNYWVSISLFFHNLIGKPSQKYGLPFSVLLRSSLGFRGAKFLRLLRSSVGIFMFGVQTYFLSKANWLSNKNFNFSIDNLTSRSRNFFNFFIGSKYY